MMIAGINNVIVGYSKSHDESYSHDKSSGHGASHGRSHEQGG